MAESTRVARLGNLEIHLKKSLEVSSDIVAQINQLPTADPWVILRYDPNNDQWRNAQTFESFEAADEQFVTLSQNQGVSNAARLEVDPGDGATREIGSGG